MSKPAVIITTIFHANKLMEEIADGCARQGWDFIIAGDSKSPDDFELEGATFLDIETQRQMGEYGKLCPERTYARKNLAYLEAIRRRAPFILETDDDNIPRQEFWQRREVAVDGRLVQQSGWANAYRYFADRFIYPRGFPVDLAMPEWQAATGSERLPAPAHSPIQQFLADENPDVDAVWRMLHQLPFTFQPEQPLVLAEGCWCPFNSQNTLWFPEAYPLLYLPATCSFRMTDIWRSFIAQRILWTCDWRLSFHSATVYQERNEHDLLCDFEDEISGYFGNKKIVELLAEAPLAAGSEHIGNNLMTCYTLLTEAGFFAESELELLSAWLAE